MGDLVVGKGIDLSVYGKLGGDGLDNVGSGEAVFPIVKVNYSYEGDIIKPGDIIVGQEKDGDRIVNPGEKVNEMIILKVYNKYSYNDYESGEKCSSPYFLGFGSDIRGLNFGNKCTECPYRSKDRARRCIYNKVLFCIVGTGSGMKLGMMYVHGVNLSGFLKFVDKIKRVKDSSGKVFSLPSYSVKVIPSTKRMVKGGVVYWLIDWENIEVLPINVVNSLVSKIEIVDKYIEDMNNLVANYYNYEKDINDVEIVKDDSVSGDDSDDIEKLFF